MALRKAAYAELRVTDIDAELDFFTDVVGLDEVGREGDIVYLGCGYDDYVDMSLRQTGTGISNFGFQVDSSDDLDRYASRLKDEGVDTARTTARVPGIEQGLSFTLPSGHAMELVVPSASASPLPYRHPVLTKHSAKHRGISPLDVDHVVVRTADVKALADFLVRTLDFHVSDAFSPAEGVWGAAWMRVGEQEHDFAIIQAGTADETFDHLSWTVTSFEHIKTAADYLAQAGIKREAGPGRHGVGGNLYVYTWSPGGNRHEFAAEMPRIVSTVTQPVIWTDPLAMFSAWGDVPPETFSRGS